jgi:hypothetical protein
LLPQYDNVLLSHADRTRFVGGLRLLQHLNGADRVPRRVLVDGKLAGMWRFDRPRRSVINAAELATLTFRSAAAARR